MKKRSVFFTLFLILSTLIWCCTGFVTVKGKRILIGNNEDNSHELIDTVVRILPATPGRYGCMLVGFNQQNFSMGGMNDQGLFYDWFSVPTCAWKSFPDRLECPEWMPVGILRECANIDEAIAFCRKYNLPIFQQAQVLLVDKTGASAIIAWGEDDLEVIRREGDYQVITNFFVNYPERGGYPSYNYDRAEDILKKGSFSIELCRSILDSVHLEAAIGRTQYSNIFELQKGDMYFYNNSNFQEYIKFNIYTEMEKGEYIYQMAPAFSEMSLQSPADRSALPGTSVNIQWRGKRTSQYAVLYSTNSDFTSAVQMDVADRQNFLFGGPGTMILWAGLLTLTLCIKKRKGVVLIPVVLIAALFFASCQTDQPDQQAESPNKEFSQSVEGLQPDTTYYWKITARTHKELTSESITQSFTTGN